MQIVVAGRARPVLVRAAQRTVRLVQASRGVVTPALVRRVNRIQRLLTGVHEVLAAHNVFRLGRGQREAELAQRRHQSLAIVRPALGEKIDILRGVGEAEQDRAGLAEEQVAHAVPKQCGVEFFCLAILKRGHSLTTMGAATRTIGDNPPSAQTSERMRHPGRACAYG